MNKGILLGIILSVSMFSLVSISQSSNMYYISTSSPQYTILPGSQFIGPLAPYTQLSIAILLGFSNTSSLNSELNYVIQHPGHYLTPSQFREYYYPSSSYVQSLINYMNSYGITYAGSYGLILQFNGTAGQIEKALNTYINIYYYPYSNVNWFGKLGFSNIGPFYYIANNVTPSLPYQVGQYIIGVVGIDSFDPHAVSALNDAMNPPMVKPGSSSDPSYISSVVISPLTIQQYFGFTQAYNQGMTGKGNTIAIIGVPESTVNVSDIYQFYSLYGIPRTGQLNVITLGNIDLFGLSGENELDAEYAGAFAPGATVDVVFSDGYVGGQALLFNGLNYYYEYYYIANYINPNVVSISVTYPESYLAAYYPALLDMLQNIVEQMSIEGTTVVAASGDWGFESNYAPPNFYIGVNDTLWYPETDPLVTAVGGTFISANSAGGIQSVSGWDYSTGGGSVVYPVQLYEITSLIPGTLNDYLTSPAVRNYPDIAFVSAGGYNIYEYGFGLPLIYAGQLFLWYGTSGAAPMTAGMLALSPERMGPINYALYHISYNGVIQLPNGLKTQGYDAWIPVFSGANPAPASAGWNYVVGPGTYNAYNMVRDLMIYTNGGFL